MLAEKSSNAGLRSASALTDEKVLGAEDLIWHLLMTTRQDGMHAFAGPFFELLSRRAKQEGVRKRYKEAPCKTCHRSSSLRPAPLVPLISRSSAWCVPRLLRTSLRTLPAQLESHICNCRARGCSAVLHAADMRCHVRLPAARNDAQHAKQAGRTAGLIIPNHHGTCWGLYKIL